MPNKMQTKSKNKRKILESFDVDISSHKKWPNKTIPYEINEKISNLAKNEHLLVFFVN